VHCKVTVLFVGNEERLKNEAKTNFDKIKDDRRVMIVNSTHELEKDYDLLIDALLGTGIEGDLKENMKKAIMQFNLLEGKKICVDIPSGMNPYSGEISEMCCNCDLIITFHDIKQGLENIKDKVKIVDIGII